MCSTRCRCRNLCSIRLFNHRPRIDYAERRPHFCCPIKKQIFGTSRLPARGAGRAQSFMSDDKGTIIFYARLYAIFMANATGDTHLLLCTYLLVTTKAYTQLHLLALFKAMTFWSSSELPLVITEHTSELSK